MLGSGKRRRRREGCVRGCRRGKRAVSYWVRPMNFVLESFCTLFVKALVCCSNTGRVLSQVEIIHLFHFGILCFISFGSLLSYLGHSCSKHLLLRIKFWCLYLTCRDFCSKGRGLHGSWFASSIRRFYNIGGWLASHLGRGRTHSPSSLVGTCQFRF